MAFRPPTHLAAVAHDPQLRGRDFFEQIEIDGHGRVAYPGAPYRHQRSPWKLERPAPHAGQHNREILSGELGLSDERLTDLRTQAII